MHKTGCVPQKTQMFCNRCLAHPKQQNIPGLDPAVRDPLVETTDLLFHDPPPENVPEVKIRDLADLPDVIGKI